MTPAERRASDAVPSVGVFAPALDRVATVAELDALVADLRPDERPVFEAWLRSVDLSRGRTGVDGYARPFPRRGAAVLRAWRRRHRSAP